MIVRTIDELKGSEREVIAPSENWVSKRLLLRDDNLGFSFHETTIFAGTETLIWYKNHLEAVYCIAGEGEVETTDEGQVYRIQPGTMYVLDKHDRHYLRAFDEDLRLVCVFNPPLVGNEVHDDEGSYPKADKHSTGPDDSH